MVVRALDAAGAALGRLAGWAFVATGAMIVWEVAARYLFNAPTIWAEEVSRLFLVWATFLPAAVLLRRRAHIRITVLTEHLGPTAQRLCELFALAWVAAFALGAAVGGTGIAWDSWRVGRTTGTMMDLPNWWTEAAVPVAFALLALQCIAEFVRVCAGHDDDAVAPAED